MFFDPRIEVPMIRPLTSEEKAVRLDVQGSVSALDEDEDGPNLDRQLCLLSEGDPHGT